ncbi:MAG: hypothetical protein IJT95_07635, partial [Abditibacteriota bacterium]|nr:hypothetical protein [Abditibacteriota bacterium]
MDIMTVESCGWNKKGNPFFVLDDPSKKDSFSKTEPAYNKSEMKNCIRMNREIRQGMQRESDRYAESLGLPENPRLQITPKRK